jgi:hypothetical protein
VALRAMSRVAAAMLVGVLGVDTPEATMLAGALREAFGVRPCGLRWVATQQQAAGRRGQQLGRVPWFGHDFSCSGHLRELAWVAAHPAAAPASGVAVVVISSSSSSSSSRSQ